MGPISRQFVLDGDVIDKTIQLLLFEAAKMEFLDGKCQMEMLEDLQAQLNTAGG